MSFSTTSFGLFLSTTILFTLMHACMSYSNVNTLYCIVLYCICSTIPFLCINDDVIFSTIGSVLYVLFFLQFFSFVFCFLGDGVRLMKDA